MYFDRIYHSAKLTDFLMFNYEFIIVEKVQFPALGLSKMTDFYFNMFYFSNHDEILPAGTLYAEK